MNSELVSIIENIVLDTVTRTSDVSISEAEARAVLPGTTARYSAIVRAFQDTGVADGAGLEVGVGEGALFRILDRVLPRVRWSGIDIPRRHDRHLVAYRAMMGPLADRVAEADISTAPFPFPDASFDLVSFSEVAEHLPPNALLPVLREIARVLKPGGHVVSTSPNLTALMNRLLLLAGRSPFHLPIPEEHLGLKTYPHIHLYTAGEFQSLSRAAGLTPVREEHLTYLVYAFRRADLPGRAALALYKFADRLITPLFPRLRDGWLTVATKK